MLIWSCNMQPTWQASMGQQRVKAWVNCAAATQCGAEGETSGRTFLSVRGCFAVPHTHTTLQAAVCLRSAATARLRATPPFPLHWEPASFITRKAIALGSKNCCKNQMTDTAARRRGTAPHTRRGRDETGDRGGGERIGPAAGCRSQLRCRQRLLDWKRRRSSTWWLYNQYW